MQVISYVAFARFRVDVDLGADPRKWGETKGDDGGCFCVSDSGIADIE